MPTKRVKRDARDLLSQQYRWGLGNCPPPNDCKLQGDRQTNKARRSVVRLCDVTRLTCWMDTTTDVEINKFLEDQICPVLGLSL